MSAERFPPDDPREWLRLARGDALLARAEVPGVPAELLCFHAQQAAEKALKALLLHLGAPVPRVHDLDRLLDVLEASGFDVPDEVRDSTFLTQYAVQTRYPIPDEPVSPEELARARESADLVLQWCEIHVIADAAEGPAGE